MSNKQQLKPLNHRKFINNVQPPAKTTLNKAPNKSQTNQAAGIPTNKNGVSQKRSTNQEIKPIKYERSGERSTKTVELYECNDFECEMEDNNYFQSQLQKNIKTQILNKTGKPQAKGQIVLPKLQNDMKMRNVKQLQKEMDEQMQKMMERELQFN